MLSNVNVFDVLVVLIGVDVEVNIEIGVFWVLGIVVVIYGVKKVIGFFGC